MESPSSEYSDGYYDNLFTPETFRERFNRYVEMICNFINKHKWIRIMLWFQGNFLVMYLYMKISKKSLKYITYDMIINRRNNRY